MPKLKSTSCIRSQASRDVIDYVSELQRLGLGECEYFYLILTMRALVRNGIYDVNELLGRIVDCADETCVVMNAFSWSYCNTGRYDSDETVCETGIIPEAFRVQPETHRTSHPIYSFSFYDRRLRPDLLKPVRDAWAKGSVLGLLCADSCVRVVSDGMPPLRGNPSIHFVERELEVPYRYLKRFPGRARFEGEIKGAAMNAYIYVRKRGADARANCWKPLVERMQSQDKIYQSDRYETLMSYRNYDLVRCARDLLRVNQFSLSSPILRLKQE